MTRLSGCPPQDVVNFYGSPSPVEPDEYGDYRFALFESYRYGVRPNLLFQVSTISQRLSRSQLSAVRFRCRPGIPAHESGFGRG